MQLVYILFPIIFSIIFFALIYMMQKQTRYKSNEVYIFGVIYFFIVLIFNLLVILGIENSASHDIEIWSGRIIEIQHKEEWDEWHPPVDTVNTYTDSEGNSYTTVTTTPGYWEHHKAKNSIKTSDDGWHNVYKSIDGSVVFNDDYPNTTEELSQYYAVGQATSSLHSYKNKLQFSKSLFKASEVDENLVKELPDYPNKVENDFNVTRLIGDIPNFKQANKTLNEWNSELNKFITDPETGKSKSWKEVNVIFVNIGDLPIEYGYALESKWDGANKNDFVVCFSMVNNEIKWVYPFSWTEVEILKINIRDYMLDNKIITDFSKNIDDICNMIAKDFDRKEMADYSYIKYQHGMSSYCISAIICIVLLIIFACIAKEEL